VNEIKKDEGENPQKSDVVQKNGKALNETANILLEAKGIIDGVVKDRVPVNLGVDVVKNKVKKEEKKEEVKPLPALLVREGFVQKSPGQLLQYLMGRVNNYRKNHAEFLDLSTKVQIWQTPMALSGANATLRNREFAAKMTRLERTRMYQSFADKLSTRQKEAKAARAQLIQSGEQERMELEARLQREQEHVEKMTRLKHEGKQALIAHRKTLVAFMAMNAGSRIGLMAKILIKDRPIRAKLKKHTVAALTIQKWIRPIIFKTKGKKIRRGFLALKELIKDYHRRWSIRRAQKATKRLLTFLKECQQQAPMKSAIQSFLRMVRRVQRGWRKYITIKTYILEVRRMQFDELEATSEDEWKKKKDKIEKELASGSSDADPIKFMGGWNLRRPPHPISEAIREQLLMEVFRSDQRAMREKMAVWTQDMKEYRSNNEMWKHVIDAQQVVNQKKSMKQLIKDNPPPVVPRRPIIIPKLSKDELWALIKKGHLRMDELVP